MKLLALRLRSTAPKAADIVNFISKTVTDIYLKQVTAHERNITLAVHSSSSHNNKVLDYRSSLKKKKFVDILVRELLTLQGLCVC